MSLGSGQMMLIAFGMALLARLVLSANGVINNAEVDALESEAIVTATGIGQGMVERITVKGYDNVFYGGIDTTTTAFTLTLGRDGAGEVAGKDTTFDDVDDYHGFRDSSSTPRFGKFYLSCSICYVNASPPFDSTATQTFMKRVTVSVTNSFLVDPSDPRKLSGAIQLSKLIAYR